ncbi:MAG: Usg-like family protein, partial [Rhodospirillaceae bacterium]|nr:Usg-like family protein [Rhodospirillaceae bacterium]
APRFPKLREFLCFWEENLEGALHIVRVASRQLVRPAEFRFVDGVLRLN